MSYYGEQAWSSIMNHSLSAVFTDTYKSWRIVNALGTKAKSSKVIENYERYMLLRILDRH